jgi:hypothetical protein
MLGRPNFFCSRGLLSPTYVLFLLSRPIIPYLCLTYVWEIDICTLYRGAILHAEAALSLMPASFTAVAMSHVEVGMINTTTSILIDVPMSHL